MCAGEVVREPDPTLASDEDWADYVFMLDNKAGVVREWWYHIPTSFWFIAERNTVTDEIVRTYRPESYFGNEEASANSESRP